MLDGQDRAGKEIGKTTEICHSRPSLLVISAPCTNVIWEFYFPSTFFELRIKEKNEQIVDFKPSCLRLFCTWSIYKDESL